MALLLGALVLGFIAARLRVFPAFWRKGMDKVGSLSLTVLLFALGLSLGSNGEVMTALPTLGLRAVLLGAGAIGGSVLLVWAASQLGGRQK